MLIIVTAVALGVVAAYWLIAYSDLETRAERSIRMYLNDQELYYEDPTVLSVFYVYIGDGEDEYYEGSTEQELKAMYQAHPERFTINTLRQYRDLDTVALYYPVKASFRLSPPQDKTPDMMLVFCDISYDVGQIHNNVLIIAAVLAGFILLLFIVSRNTLKTLDKKDADMKNFFANASHELKTPLMAIKGNADGIMNNYVETKTGCLVIEKEADRMSGLISSILDIARLDSGMMVPDVTRTDVREIIYDAISSVMQEAANRSLEIQVELEEPVIRECDESMLYSAFSNILTNDLRYARSWIRVSSEPKGEKVRIRFENDGSPITEEDQLHVFDRFYKGEKGQNGIGMALAQEYVKLHGSEIQVYTTEQSTIFEILL